MAQAPLYPLSQTQQLNLWSRTFTVHKQVNNIATSAFAEAQLDLGVLRQAVDQAIARNDSFGIRLVKAGKATKQYFGERKALGIKTVDFSNRTDAEMTSYFERIAKKPLALYETPLAKIIIVRAPDGACGLFVCVCHLAMDTWAINLFYRDVFGIYKALVDGTPLPAPLGAFEDLLQKEIEYAGSLREARDREFWEKEVAGYGRRPTFTNVNGTRFRDSWRRIVRKPDHPYGRGVYLRTTAKHEVLPVWRSDVVAMGSFCTEHRVSLPVLFQVALRTYLSRVCELTDDVTFSNTIARRGTLLEKGSGGDRASGVHLRTILGPERTFAEALDVMGAKVNEVLRHAEYPLMEILEIEAKEYGITPLEGYSAATFAFQAMPMDLGDGTAMRSEWYCNGTSQMTCYIMVMGGNTPDTLRVCYEYWDKQIQVTWLHRCHAFMMDVIRAGIANPSITLGELLELPLA